MLGRFFQRPKGKWEGAMQSLQLASSTPDGYPPDQASTGGFHRLVQFLPSGSMQSVKLGLDVYLRAFVPKDFQSTLDQGAALI